MKKMLLIFPILVYLMVSAVCRQINYKDRSLVSFWRSGNEHRMKIHHPGETRELTSLGKVEFNDDETEIETISKGGYIEYRINDSILFAESNYHGEILYRLNIEGEEIPPNNFSRNFITRSVKEMISHGFDAEGRMQRIYEKGGISLMLQEVEKIKSQHIRSMYFDYMLSVKILSPREVNRVMNSFAVNIDADHEKANLLKKVEAKYFDDPSIVLNYFQAIEHIDAEHEKVKTLKNSFEHHLTNAQIVQVYEIVSLLQSDHEKTNLIAQLIDKGMIAEAVQEKLFYAIRSINAEHEKINLFKKLVGKNFTAEKPWLDLIHETAQLHSDHEKTNLLVLIAQRMPQTEQSKAAYMLVSKSIQPGPEYDRVVKALQ